MRIVSSLLAIVFFSLPPDGRGQELGQSPDATQGAAPQTLDLHRLLAHWSYSWGDTKKSSVDIGTSVKRTCFLAGITGNLVAGDGAYFVGVYRKEDRYSIRFSPAGFPDPPTPLQVFVRCVDVWSPPWEFQHSGGESQPVPMPAEHHNVCFLTRFEEVGGGAGGFSEADHHVRLYPDEVDDGVWGWFFGGTHPGYVPYATCFKAPQVIGSWHWTAPDPGSRKDLLTDVSNATCGLTGIGGRFDGNDWSDGVFISQEEGRFYLNTTNGKSGWATCITGAPVSRFRAPIRPTTRPD